MTGVDLRSLLRGLGEEARDADLVDRALAGSRRLRMRRVALAATSTAAVLVAAVIVAATAAGPGPAPAPPATAPPRPGQSTTEQATGTAASSAAPPVSTSSPQAQHAFPGTVYYRRPAGTSGQTLYAWSAGEQARALLTLPQPMVVSPDARRVVWVSQDNGPDGPATLMVSDLDGGNVRALAEAANNGGLCNGPAWSPDSRRVLYQRLSATATRDARWSVIDVDSGQRADLDNTSGCYPTWSPDGATVAWYGGSTILLTDARGGTPRSVPPIGGVHRCGGGVYAVDPGGRRVLAGTPFDGACGDGPGATTPTGVVVDTATGEILDLPVAGALTSGMFLADGGLVARAQRTGELVLFDRDLRIVARTPVPPMADDSVLMAYQP